VWHFFTFVGWGAQRTSPRSGSLKSFGTAAGSDTRLRNPTLAPVLFVGGGARFAIVLCFKLTDLGWTRGELGRNEPSAGSSSAITRPPGGRKAMRGA